VQAIARYKLIDHLRHTRSAMANVPIEDAVDFKARDDRDGVESAYDLERLLAKLPAKVRRVIRYVKVDGLSVAEAASRCGMSQSAIKVSVHRGIKAMTAAISQGRGR
jgi:RNA polymerase sigma-70 factor (ECF subfamily)